MGCCASKPEEGATTKGISPTVQYKGGNTPQSNAAPNAIHPQPTTAIRPLQMAAVPASGFTGTPGNTKAHNEDNETQQNMMSPRAGPIGTNGVSIIGISHQTVRGLAMGFNIN